MDPKSEFARAAERIAFGAALGDALGVPGAGKSAQDIAERWPQGYGYNNLAALGCFRGYAAADWSAATDTSVLAMRAICDYFNGYCDDPTTRFAAKLATWQRTGFSELGDTGGVNLDEVSSRVVTAMRGNVDPRDAAAAVARSGGGGAGAAARAWPAALTVDPAAWAEEIAAATHADPESLAAASAVAGVVRALARGESAAGPLEAALRGLPPGPKRIRCAAAARCGVAARRGPPPIGMAPDGVCTRPGDAAGVFAVLAWVGARAPQAGSAGSAGSALWYSETIKAVAAAGGESCLYGAIAGAAAGAAVSELPADWLAAVPPENARWLRKEVGGYLGALATQSITDFNDPLPGQPDLVDLAGQADLADQAGQAGQPAQADQAGQPAQADLARQAGQPAQASVHNALDGVGF